RDAGACQCASHGGSGGALCHRGGAYRSGGRRAGHRPPQDRAPPVTGGQGYFVRSGLPCMAAGSPLPVGDATSRRHARSASTMLAVKFDIVVIGAGQAGLSSAYHLRRLGLEPDRDFVTFDQAPGPGGAWQFRWPSLPLATANRAHDLPGLKFEDVIDVGAAGSVQASVAVPQYYEAYERAFDLRVHRPVGIKVVCDRGERLRVETDAGMFSVRGILNATGTWETPYVPDYPGR